MNKIKHIEHEDLWVSKIYYHSLLPSNTRQAVLNGDNGKQLMIPLFRCDDYKEDSIQHNKYLALLSEAPYNAYKFHYRVRAYEFLPNKEKVELVGYTVSEHPWFV